MLASDKSHKSGHRLDGTCPSERCNAGVQALPCVQLLHRARAGARATAGARAGARARRSTCLSNVLNDELPLFQVLKCVQAKSLGACSSLQGTSTEIFLMLGQDPLVTGLGDRSFQLCTYLNDLSILFPCKHAVAALVSAWAPFLQAKLHIQHLKGPACLGLRCKTGATANRRTALQSTHGCLLHCTRDSGSC